MCLNMINGYLNSVRIHLVGRLLSLLVPLLQMDEREDFFRIFVFNAVGESAGLVELIEDFTPVFVGGFVAHFFFFSFSTFGT
jgi:hypothetical protein